MVCTYATNKKTFQSSNCFYSLYSDAVRDNHLYLSIQINVSRKFARHKQQQNIYSCKPLYNAEIVSPAEMRLRPNFRTRRSFNFL